MSREYVVSGGGITLANAASTLVFVRPSTTQSLEFLRCWASQSANATSAQQRVQMHTQVAAFWTGATSATPSRLKISDPASVITGATDGSAGTAGITNATATEGAGTKTLLNQDAFNVLNGHLWVPTPPETIVMNASSASGFGYHFPVAPASLTNWSFGVIFREL